MSLISNIENDGIWIRPTIGQASYSYDYYRPYIQTSTTIDGRKAIVVTGDTYHPRHAASGTGLFLLKEYPAAAAHDYKLSLLTPDTSGLAERSQYIREIDCAFGITATSSSVSLVGNWRRKYPYVTKDAELGIHWLLVLQYSWTTRATNIAEPWGYSFYEDPVVTERDIEPIIIVEDEDDSVECTIEGGLWQIRHRDINGNDSPANLYVDDVLVGYNISEATIAPEVNKTYTYQWNDEDERKIRIVAGVNDRPMKHQTAGKQRAGDTIWRP